MTNLTVLKRKLRNIGKHLKRLKAKRNYWSMSKLEKARSKVIEKIDVLREKKKLKIK